MASAPGKSCVTDATVSSVPTEVEERNVERAAYSGCVSNKSTDVNSAGRTTFCSKNIQKVV